MKVVFLLLSILLIACSEKDDSPEGSLDVRLFESFESSYTIDGVSYYERMDIGGGQILRQVNRGYPQNDSISLRYDFTALGSKNLYILNINDSSDTDTIRYKFADSSLESLLTICSNTDEACIDYRKL